MCFITIHLLMRSVEINLQDVTKNSPAVDLFNSFDSRTSGKQDGTPRTSL